MRNKQGHLFLVFKIASPFFHALQVVVAQMNSSVITLDVYRTASRVQALTHVVTIPTVAAPHLQHKHHIYQQLLISRRLPQVRITNVISQR